MKTQPLWKTDWPIWVFLLIPFIWIALYWNHLPSELPSHWNAAGEVDDYSSKGFVVFLMPLIAVFSYLLMVAVPYIDPKRKTKPDQKALRVFRYAMPLMMIAFFGIIAAKWLGYDFHIGRPISLSVIVLFGVIGNYMISVKPNYFIGIRTPWTLENEEIWRKTHRLGGWLWVGASVVLLVLWFFIQPEKLISFLVGGAVLISLIPVGYSFYQYTIISRQQDDTSLTQDM